MNENCIRTHVEWLKGVTPWRNEERSARRSAEAGPRRPASCGVVNVEDCVASRAEAGEIDLHVDPRERSSDTDGEGLPLFQEAAASGIRGPRPCDVVLLVEHYVGRRRSGGEG